MATSSAASDAAAKWLAQMAEMRASLAKLNLPQPAVMEDAPDDDVSLSEESSSGLWDSIFDRGEPEDGYSSDADDFDEEPLPEKYGAEWFARRCAEVASAKDQLLSADAFQAQVVDILESNRSEDELQSMLTDLVGFDDLDFVIELLSHRQEIVAALPRKANQHGAPSGKNRLLTRAEREEALRRRDLEHKTAALAPTQTKEVHYPHVYRAYNPGNTLSHSGRKYALPVGSKRLEFETYEEYFVPAGKAGGLLPGQKLVMISDLDGLCRRTFKGYKSLNRMQSLVYPVAYQSSENMLICAPTGAVSSAVLSSRRRSI